MQIMLFKTKIIIELILLLLLTRNYLIRLLKKKIDTDNIMQIDKEENIDFSHYSTTIKAIAIYNSNINLSNECKNESKTQINNIYYKTVKLKEYINLARSHGIYGFAFYYYCFHNLYFSNELIDIILKNKNLKFNFLLLIENNNPKNSTLNNCLSEFYDDLRRYIIDKRYIKFNDKYLIMLNNNDFNFTDINILRTKFKQDKIGEIFILSKTNDFNLSIENSSIYNGFYYYPSYDSLERVFLNYNKTMTYFYTHLLYNNLLMPPLSHNNIFRMSISLTKYPIFLNKTKSFIFGDYSPQKYYFLNKVIIDWTKRNYYKNNQYIFIDDFSNLLKDDILGYANINHFSKALFELPLTSNFSNNFNIYKLKQDIFVLIQAHIFYTDLIEEIINKTNNIPVPFDLYITTNTHDKKIYLVNYVKKYSYANNFEILIAPNKGRDIIPFLYQIKDIIKKYKYLCHIHTKKHLDKEDLGKYWQRYLYENLLGNQNIINQILSDFENNNKLGFIFPEHYYPLIKFAYEYKSKICNHMDKIFDILFPNMKIRTGNILNFPAGNMFWAKTEAIHQIFNEKIINLAPRERGQIDGTILHAIERFWLYLVKLNGFYYKTILYYIL